MMVGGIQLVRIEDLETGEVVWMDKKSGSVFAVRPVMVHPGSEIGDIPVEALQHIDQGMEPFVKGKTLDIEFDLDGEIEKLNAYIKFKMANIVCNANNVSMCTILY